MRRKNMLCSIKASQQPPTAPVNVTNVGANTMYGIPQHNRQNEIASVYLTTLNDSHFFLVELSALSHSPTHPPLPLLLFQQPTLKNFHFSFSATSSALKKLCFVAHLHIFSVEFHMSHNYHVLL